MWILMLFIGMALGFLTILLVSFLKSLVPKWIDHVTDSIVHADAKMKPPKPAPAPTLEGGKVHFDSGEELKSWYKGQGKTDEEFEQWYKEQQTGATK